LMAFYSGWLTLGLPDTVPLYAGCVFSLKVCDPFSPRVEESQGKIVRIKLMTH